MPNKMPPGPFKRPAKKPSVVQAAARNLAAKGIVKASEVLDKSNAKKNYDAKKRK